MTSEDLKDQLKELDIKYAQDERKLINTFFLSITKFKIGDWLQQGDKIIVVDEIFKRKNYEKYYVLYNGRKITKKNTISTKKHDLDYVSTLTDDEIIKINNE